jgi:hypothetical protein
MFKKMLLTAALLAVGSAKAALNSGDLAFTAFNADEDGWAMVSLVDIAAGSTVYFTDNEWDGSAFNTGESYFSWNSGSAQINAGTVIRFSSIDTTALAASVGTLSRSSVSGSSNYGLSQTADTIYAYLGSAANTPTSFLAAISSGSFGTAADGYLSNTGLAIGAGAIQLQASSDYAEYKGLRSGQTSFAGYKALLSNVANWNDLGDGAYASKIPDATAFSVSAVPEPRHYLMLLVGLVLIGASAFNRRT